MIELLESRRLLAAAPLISSVETTPLNYTEGQTLAVTGALNLSDADSPNLASAKVSITGNFQSGQDVLAFANTSAITGTYNATTGVLTLTGSDTVAHYQAALRSVTYHSGDNPGTSPRTISFVANDGQADSNAATRSIAVTPVNNAPVLSAVETTALNVTPGQVATPITSAIVVTDADDTNLSGATVTITGNYQNGQDLLAFTNTGSITGSFDAATGKLTLSGTSSVSSYQSALRSITYRDTSATPSSLQRTLSIQVTDGHTTSPFSNTATRAVNVAPVLTGIETTALDYAINNASTTRPATNVTSSLVVTDSAGTNITSATVQITGGYQSGQDVLAFTNTAKITGTFDATTGKLTLTGAATAAEYQAALRTVTYKNSSTSATPQARTLTFIVNESATAASNSATRTINVHSSTVLGGIETTPVTYTVGQAPVPLTSTLTVTDANGTSLSGATVKLTSMQTGDVLSFKNTSTITGTYDATTGTLTLTGTDTLANYQSALRSITFSNTSGTPGTQSRTVSFQVGTTLLSTAATRSISVTAATQPAIISGVEGRRLRHRHHRGPTQVAPDLTITAPTGTTNLTGATIRIGGFHAGDTLSFTKTGSITGTFDSASGVLTLTGTDTVANYQQVLRSITFDNGGGHSRGLRTISFQTSIGSTASAIVSRSIRVRR